MKEGLSRRDFLKVSGAVAGAGMLRLSWPFLAAAEPARNGGITWPQAQALPTFATPTSLDVIDVQNLQDDVQLLLVTLQGVLARQRPRLYLLMDEDEGPLTWLNTIKVPYTTQSDPWSLVAKYAAELKGLIVYDPQMWDTVNVATTLAGLKSAVVASPDVAAKLTAAPYNLPVLDDLRGRFSSKLDAYTWQYQNLWPLTTHRMLTGIGPSQRISLPPGIPSYYTTLLKEDQDVRDASNRSVFTVDLSPFLGSTDVYLRFDDSITTDGWGPSVHQVTVLADGQTLAQFVPGTTDEQTYLYDADGSQMAGGTDAHRFADGSNYFVYRFTPSAGTKKLTAQIDMWNQYLVSATSTQPPTSDTLQAFIHFRDYIVANQAMVFWLDPNVDAERALFEQIMSGVEPNTPYLGWFAQDVAGEFSGTQLTSEHSVYVLAADYLDNATVFSGVPARMPRPRPAVAAPPPLQNKIYVTLVMTEGDNLQYDQHRLRKIWDDPGRGRVPINWTIDPLLLDAAPSILSYYASTATPNDLLMAGPSGAGYIYPTPWPDDTFRLYTKQSSKYMRAAGINTVYVLDRVNSQSVPLSDAEAAAYIHDVRPLGIMLNFESYTKTTILNGSTPQSVILGASNATDAGNAIAAAAQGWDGTSPLFLAIGVIAWNATPSDVATMAQALGSQYQVVLADQYFQLIRQANGLHG